MTLSPTVFEHVAEAAANVGEGPGTSPESV